VAAVWHTIFSDDAEWLACRILTFDLTSEHLQETLSRPTVTTREKAFQTILKNRTYHGGILAPGSAPLKSGENGKGIASRWYPATLARRIRNLIPLRDRVTSSEGDALAYLIDQLDDKATTFFIAPPIPHPARAQGKGCTAF
jgi:DNA adenine methylase